MMVNIPPRGLKQMLDDYNEEEANQDGPDYPVDPDTSVMLGLDSPTLKVAAMISLRDLADAIKRSMDEPSVATLVMLLTGDGSGGDQDGDQDQSNQEDESEDESDQHQDDDGDPDGDDYDPYGEEDEPGDELGDGEEDGFGETDGGLSGQGDIDADVSGDDADGEGGGFDGIDDPDKHVGEGDRIAGGDREYDEPSNDFPDDILAALSALGVDPSKL